MEKEMERKMFLDAWEHEFATTLKVLKAFPAERQEYKPHEKSKSAKDLAWVFAAEEKTIIDGVLAGHIDWRSMQKAPETFAEVLSHLEKQHKEQVEHFKHAPISQLEGTVPFTVAPKTQKDLPKMQVLWTILMDQIHHRGQFSVYLRLVGAKVPSIYGPTADEPWM